MKLTWQSIRENKCKQLRKEEYKRAEYVANFDIDKRIKILMKKVQENPPGTFEYGLTDLYILWEEFNGTHLLSQGPYWIEDEEIKAWVFEEILNNLRENDIDHEKIKGHYLVKITMP